MQRAFMIDKEKQPLMSCKSARTNNCFKITIPVITVQKIRYHTCQLLQNNHNYYYSNIDNPVIYKKTTNVSLHPRFERPRLYDTQIKRVKRR